MNGETNRELGRAASGGTTMTVYEAPSWERIGRIEDVTWNGGRQILFDGSKSGVPTEATFRKAKDN